MTRRQPSTLFFLLLAASTVSACGGGDSSNDKPQTLTQIFHEQVIAPIHDEYDKSIRPALEESEQLNASLREAREQAHALSETAKDAKQMALAAKSDAVAAKDKAGQWTNEAKVVAYRTKYAVQDGIENKLPEWEHSFAQTMKEYSDSFDEWLKALFRRNRTGPGILSSRSSGSTTAHSPAPGRPDRLHGGGRR